MRVPMIAAALIVGVATAGAAHSAAAWDLIDVREVGTQANNDTFAVAGHQRFQRVMVCAYRQPAPLSSMDVTYGNGGHNGVNFNAGLRAGQCTPAFTLAGAPRDIDSIQLLYQNDTPRADGRYSRRNWRRNDNNAGGGLVVILAE